MKRAAFLAFGVAGVAGLALAATTAWWLVAVGLLCVLAAWYYTGGSKPYGYLGLGEVMVFVFFGLVAVVGTTYVQTEEWGDSGWTALVAGAGVGALACAILVANNLRDIPTDTVAGKITLAVRLGDRRTRRFYAALVLLAVGAAGRRRRAHHPVGAARPAVPGPRRAGVPDRARRRRRPGSHPGAPADRAGRAGLGGSAAGSASRRLSQSASSLARCSSSLCDDLRGPPLDLGGELLALPLEQEVRRPPR